MLPRPISTEQFYCSQFTSKKLFYETHRECVLAFLYLSRILRRPRHPTRKGGLWYVEIRQYHYTVSIGNDLYGDLSPQTAQAYNPLTEDSNPITLDNLELPKKSKHDESWIDEAGFPPKLKGKNNAS